ncbi:sporulation-specific diadenylate cyclase CdaS [Paenibacillus sp. GCM10023252]|uniref:sporulation-specific diadenylate cyclase CdaS n=1 Tax=Paenibacillus sp. GCM10023252 TaxID=3252649 RepID=UPI00360FB85E
MTIPNNDCDFSPMRQTLKEDLVRLSLQLQSTIDSFDMDNYCMLSEFESIKKNFIRMESAAATFYLNCYLSPYTDKYRDLSTSIQNMSERRHGALIAVERRDALDPYIHSGMSVEAVINHSLLESIFYIGSPLHDGAVLIRGNQIVSARNILPVSTLEHSEEKLGTRHRAAIGLTERCDAIVLVVSEETGKASFAANGVLYPVITPGI